MINKEIDVYTIIFDNGKPSESKADGEADLRAELKRIYEAQQNGDYAYCDVKVYNGDGEDISESQFITEMISEIMEQADGESDGESQEVLK